MTCLTTIGFYWLDEDCDPRYINRCSVATFYNSSIMPIKSPSKFNYIWKQIQRKISIWIFSRYSKIVWVSFNVAWKGDICLVINCRLTANWQHPGINLQKDPCIEHELAEYLMSWRLTNVWCSFWVIPLQSPEKISQMWCTLEQREEIKTLIILSMGL